MNLLRFIFVLPLIWSSLAAGQAPLTDEGDPARIERERTRIGRERQAEETRFAAQEANCYQRFAVNDCLREVRVRRRAALEELRRQEVLLNDAERQSQAADQIRRLEEKHSPQARREEDERRATAREDLRQRLERAETKQSERAAYQGQGTRARPPAAPASVPGRAAQARQEFDDKQRQAQERRAKRDKALADKAGQPPVRPLPTPP